jgi:hypothetical protein
MEAEKDSERARRRIFRLNDAHEVMREQDSDTVAN